MENDKLFSNNTLLYAIGDIHGCADLLSCLMEKIKANAAQFPDFSKELVFLGDYIDRGVASKEVIEYLLHSLPSDMKKIFLRGNHEDMMLRFLAGELKIAHGWLQCGGAATLASYGINPFQADIVKQLSSLRKELLEKTPKDHLDFLKKTEISYMWKEYYFVHAGIRPGKPLEKQTDEDRLWIGHDFCSSTVDYGKTIIHGHSVTSDPDEQYNRIGIDTGAYATGRLTCLVLRGDERRFIGTTPIF